MSDDTPDTERTDVTLRNTRIGEMMGCSTEAINNGVMELDGAVPKEDLRALIEEWRENPSFEVTQDAPYQAIKQCADDLEALLDGENDG